MYGLVCLSLRNLTQPWNLVHAPLVSVLSYLQPRFAYILDHYEHARSRRRVSVRHGEAPLYNSNNTIVLILEQI